MVEPKAGPAAVASEMWDGTGVRFQSFRYLVLTVAGTILLTVSAKIHIPFWPVPLTMQTCAVLIIGMAYGPRLGAATVAAYLAVGAIGLPVFSGISTNGVGFGYILGPTGGYLVGFLIAAYVVGLFARRGWGRRLSLALTAMLIGVAVIFACGYGWLSTQMGPAPAFAAGVLPFIPGEGLKIALAAALSRAAWQGIEYLRQY